MIPFPKDQKKMQPTQIEMKESCSEFAKNPIALSLTWTPKSSNLVPDFSLIIEGFDLYIYLDVQACRFYLLSKTLRFSPINPHPLTAQSAQEAAQEAIGLAQEKIKNWVKKFNIESI